MASGQTSGDLYEAGWTCSDETLLQLYRGKAFLHSTPKEPFNTGTQRVPVVIKSKIPPQRELGCLRTNLYTELENTL